MNNELSEFFITFTTVGIAELKADMDELSRKLDDIGDDLDDTGKKGESFFGKMPGWVKSIIGLGSAFLSLRGIINQTFDVNGRILELNNLAKSASMSASELEKYAIATEGFGGSAEDVSSFFRNLNSMLYDMSLGRYSESQEEQMALNGFTVQYNQGLSVEQNRQRFMDELTRVFSSGNINSIQAQRLAEIFGISDPMRSFFEAGKSAQQGLLSYGAEQSVLSGGDAFKDAIELNKARQELARTWDKLFVEFQPLLTKLIDQVVIPLTQWLGKYVEQAIPKIDNWLGTALPEIKDFITRLINTMVALFNWAFNDGDWERVRGAWNGSSEAEIQDAIETADARNVTSKAGMVAGGILGAVGGAFVGHPFLGAAAGSAAGSWGGGKIFDLFDGMDTNTPVMVDSGSSSPFLSTSSTTDFTGTLKGGITINVDPSKSVSYTEFTTPVDMTATTATGTK